MVDHFLKLRVVILGFAMLSRKPDQVVLAQFVYGVSPFVQSLDLWASQRGWKVIGGERKGCWYSWRSKRQDPMFKGLLLWVGVKFFVSPHHGPFFVGEVHHLEGEIG